MTTVEVIGFLAAIAFFVISVIRNVAKQQRQELQHAQKKAKEEVHHKPAAAVKKKVTKERTFVEELKIEQKPLRTQKRASLPSGCTLRAAILSKEILDLPVGLR